MKKASIVSIGNEVLSGQTVGTNAAYLGRKLVSVGIPVVSGYTVGDEIDLIVRSLKLAGNDADVVLVTGGLGPTDDDLTRQAMAKFLGVELEFRSELFAVMENFFGRRGLVMPAKNKIQAYMPAGSEALANNLGTAPGIMVRAEEKLFVAMPGVPSEMKAMFEDSVLGQLEKLAERQTVVVRKLKCFGTGESNMAESLGDLMMRGRNPLINCTAHYGVITLHIIATADVKEQAELMVEKDEKMLTEMFGDLIYGRDDQSLAEVVGDKLAAGNKTIAVAESCTGGGLAKMLTDISGSSRYFTYGWVTYSNEAKISQLGVGAELIEEHGAVSAEVAAAMACGAASKAGADFGIGITGIAGPGGESEQKPVGLVYISVVSKEDCETKRFVFSHDREFVRFRAAQTALNMLRLRLCV